MDATGWIALIVGIIVVVIVVRDHESTYETEDDLVEKHWNCKTH